MRLNIDRIVALKEGMVVHNSKVSDTQDIENLYDVELSEKDHFGITKMFQRAC